VLIERSGRFVPGVADDWTSLRLEVWPGPVREMNGPAFDRTATEPLATAPMMVDGRRVSGELRFDPMLDRDNYYVAVTGIGLDGNRWELSRPDITTWLWHGTPLELVFATWR